MKNNIIIFIIVTFLFSCNKQPKEDVVFKAEIKKTTIKKDTTLVEFADLPFRIDSTAYLIHVKGYYKKYDWNSNKYGSKVRGSNDYNSYSVARHGKNHISGNITNVKFQQINSTKLMPLTNKNIRINAINYLKKIYKNTGKQFLLYEVIDMDTNNDKKLNNEDVTSLYISNINGKNFKKLSTKYYNLLNWNVIEINNTLYFRTREDINKNGKFDKNDKIHYQFVNLNDKDLTVITYNPL